ncbi:MAG: trans-aconitate 2-methyltransferase [Acidimicrobiaceae bacterium]|jgi:trans-aconitate 2-methyltransferase|nr:trans-aconitate 2-methyltransferase [Acidimicrobiaceae bacterium]
MNAGPREWDAQTYDQISEPQYQWGLEVLERLEPRADEVVIDAGCGSGRVTERLLERLPDGQVVGVDGSAEMIKVAAEKFAGDERVTLIVSDLLELTPELLEQNEAPTAVDALFSTATFHWITDHERLFSRIHSVLRPGGRLVAQCGGEGNVAEHARAIASVATQPQYIEHFEGMTMMWNFANPAETEERLHGAGFEDVSCWLEDKPVQPENPYDFTTTVTMGPHLTRLPEQKRRAFAEAVLELSPDPLVLNYVRLNIDARRA